MENRELYSDKSAGDPTGDKIFSSMDRPVLVHPVLRYALFTCG
jgi:hypothetical protein